MTSLQKNLQFRFNAQVQQILSEADALHNEADRQGLKEFLHKYKNSFAKDSLDCGLTNIHTVRIPTNPNAPPTFVRQYKIPIASYEPVQEIVDSMLEKGVIRPCNSTYSAPIWPVLKPNGKWPWSAADTALCISTIIGYVVTLILAFLLHKRVNAVQESFNKCTSGVPRIFRRDKTNQPD